jgi:hypothetical protein
LTLEIKRKNNLINRYTSHTIDSLELEIKKQDNLINRYYWATSIMFTEICQDQYDKFETLLNSSWKTLEIEGTGGY